MFNKRLFTLLKYTKTSFILNIIMNIITLLTNINMMFIIVSMLVTLKIDISSIILFFILLILRFISTYMTTKFSYISAKTIKKHLRNQIYQKLLYIGPNYLSYISTSKIVQLAIEGVDQLEIYFSSYLPQFFHALVAPIILFVYISKIHIQIALIFIVLVPLIPISIMLVAKFAKKIIAKYYGKYTTMADHFLENLQGLTTLKLLDAATLKQQQMDKEAEEFRKVTMKVLIMQLNSITIMDIMAYGGYLTGILVALYHYYYNHINLEGLLLVIALGADFFLPMRLLGSYFHIAMNGVASSKDLFTL